MYTPSREDFAALAARGNLVPVYRELLADDDTPVSAYAAVGDAPYSFLLESVVGGATWAAYSFVGVAPRAIVRWQAGEATVTWLDVEGGGDFTAPQRTVAYATTDPLEALEMALAELHPVDVPGLPRFWGGAVGWIAYDCVNAFDHVGKPPAPDLPPLCMALTDTLVIFDNLRQTLKVVATARVDDDALAERSYDRACARIDAVVARLRAPR